MSTEEKQNKGRYYLTWEQERAVCKELADKCMEQPNRPVYTICSLQGVEIEDGPSFLAALEPGKKATLRCHIQEIREHSYATIQENNPYASVLDTYPDPNGTPTTLTLSDIQAVEKLGNSVCIFTPHAVYTSINFEPEYRWQMNAFEAKKEAEREAIKNMSALRTALNDSSFLKRKFKAFCDQNQIHYGDKKGIFGPKEELEKIESRIIKKLESLGIDYTTATSISKEDYEAVISAARTALQDIKREAESISIQEMVSPILQQNKPCILIQNWNAQGNSEKGSFCGYFSPLEHDIPKITEMSSEIYFQNYGAKFSQMHTIANGITVFETDKAMLFCVNEHAKPDQLTMIQDLYREHLREQGKEYTPYTGRTSIQYLLAEPGCQEYLSTIRSIDGQAEDRAQQIANWLAQTSPDGANLYYASNAYLRAIDCFGVDQYISASSILPGMHLYIPSECVQSMGTTEFDAAPQLLTVIDCDTHTDIPIIVTDKGILTTQDLTREIAIAYGQNPEIDSQSQGPEHPGNR